MPPNNHKALIVNIGDTVKIHFTCTFEDGTMFDNSTGKEPLQFTLGKDEMIRGMQEAVMGMSIGESKTIKIPFEKAFGSYNRDKVKVITRDQFIANTEPEIGMEFHIQESDSDTAVVRVTEVTDSTVTLDANHPLAGKNLIFDVQLLDIEQGNQSKAAEYYKKGVELQNEGKSDEAFSCYRKVMDLDPAFVPAYYNAAVILYMKGERDKAAVLYQLAIGLNDNFIEAHLNLGIIYKEIRQADEAIRCFQRALEIKPDYADAQYNLGNAYVMKRQFDEAIQCYRKTLAIQRDHAQAHWNAALLDLQLGNFKEGWQGYEWRWKLDSVMAPREFHEPLWDGTDISDCTFLLHAEQGLGDTIQFIRYAPLIAAKGAKVIIECQRELASLLRHVEGVHQVVSRGDQLPEFDIHCPLLSLPRILDTTLGTIPAKVPYISPDALLIQKWRDNVSPDNSALKIGLAWAGDPSLKDDHERSLSLKTFALLGQFDDVTFYSLQKGKAAEQATDPSHALRLIDFSNELHDFSDTAALIVNLDLIISVDTAIAHLAGALGKPVWTLIPWIPDWRWMLEREDSPWYPTMRLFRQPSYRDWVSVINDVFRELRIFIANNITSK